MTRNGLRDATKESAGAKRGRPKGSVSLTKKREETILQFIRAGAFAEVAAQAAGVSPRTFRDWMARGEGRHPTRGSTPQLRRFADAVNQARAEARLGAEVRMYRERPAYWLSRAARTTEEMAGWTDPPHQDAEPLWGIPLSHLTDQELDESIERLQRVVEADAREKARDSGQA